MKHIALSVIVYLVDVYYPTWDFFFKHDLLVEKNIKPPLVQSRSSSGGVTTGPLQMRMSASVYI